VQHSLTTASLSKPRSQFAVSSKLQHWPGSKPHTVAVLNDPMKVRVVSWRSFMLLPIVVFVKPNVVRLEVLPPETKAADWYSPLPPLSLIARISAMYSVLISRPNVAWSMNIVYRPSNSSSSTEKFFLVTPPESSSACLTRTWYDTMTVPSDPVELTGKKDSPRPTTSELLMSA